MYAQLPSSVTFEVYNLANNLYIFKGHLGRFSFRIWGKYSSSQFKFSFKEPSLGHVRTYPGHYLNNENIWDADGNSPWHVTFSLYLTIC